MTAMAATESSDTVNRLHFPMAWYLSDCPTDTIVPPSDLLCQTHNSVATGLTAAHHEMHEQAVDRFVVLPKALNYAEAIEACAEGKTSPAGVPLRGLASVHTGLEMQHVSEACDRVAGGGSGQTIAGVANGCWIGFRSNDYSSPGGTPRTGFVSLIALTCTSWKSVLIPIDTLTNIYQVWGDRSNVDFT